MLTQKQCLDVGMVQDSMDLRPDMLAHGSPATSSAM